MSGNQRESSVNWDSSTEEEDAVTYDTKYNMRLRESLRNPKQPATIENEISAEPRKRGRGPSKRPCLNRNALMARENRLKKKAYLEKIENKLSFYQQENKNLVNLIRKQGIHIKQLSGEVAYLRSVLYNNTSITALLKTINEGLQKINTQKNSIRPNHTSESPNKTIPQQNSCNPKEELLNSPNKDIFIANDNSNSFMEHNINESQSSESYDDSRKQFTCKNLDISKISSCFLDYDHTYTVSKNPAVDIKNNLPNKDKTNTITSTTSSVSEDSYMDNAKELDPLLPIAEADLPNEERKESDIAMDFDQLSTFNMDIFDDLPKCEDIMTSVDGLNDPTNLFTEDDISQTLDNTGICLHVNSDKVSLEFCSICHLNSKNSGLN
ncbi:uncharacterized protein LOC108623544 isoform X1 [Ceratina calcarata]|uniref:Uncharacterized protein LOC108623544 isoform X1 n=1 Tax=Ceratina calcarata TaxID=156304 RepID=A0AAJ7S038_9HYME|nr:uncharacterized protein LOC108623544 isoform X1 [Ceratina calcarata]XP_026668179.1 uncharacterized protein LOC108623544 isoform X1 [Ceratina calcarata]